MKHIKLFESFISLSENMKYHIDNNIPVLENVFRPHSEAFYNLIKEARELFDGGKIEVSEHDKHLFETTDLGYFGIFEGQTVPLDLPIENIEEINETEYKGREVELNKPTRSSGPKKYKVYVRNPKTGNIKQVNFGDVKGGLTTKINNPAARKSFIARHNCRREWKPSDKLSAGYWSCHLPRYKNIYSGSYSGYW